MDRLTGHRSPRTVAELSTQTDPTPTASAVGHLQETRSNRSNFPLERQTVYSIYPHHNDAEEIDFTIGPTDLVTMPTAPQGILMSSQHNDLIDPAFRKDDLDDISIPQWLFDDASDEEDDPSELQVRAASSTKQVTFAEAIEDFRLPAKKLHMEFEQQVSGSLNKVLFDLPKDPQAVQFYVNPRSATPHHEIYPELKVAITASGGRKSGTQKFKFTKWTTGSQVHDKVRTFFGIPEDEELHLAFPQYEMILPNDRELFQYGLRYFPSFLAQVPANFQRGDLMEVQYLGIGPNVNGDPTRIREHHAMKLRRPSSRS